MPPTSRRAAANGTRWITTPRSSLVMSKPEKFCAKQPISSSRLRRGLLPIIRNSGRETGGELLLRAFLRFWLAPRPMLYLMSAADSEIKGDHHGIEPISYPSILGSGPPNCRDSDRHPFRSRRCLHSQNRWPGARGAGESGGIAAAEVCDQDGGWGDGYSR